MTNTKTSLKSQPYIYRFGDTFDEFIQVLVEQFTLTREGNGKCMEFEVNNNSLSIRDPKSRYHLNEYIVNSNRNEPNTMLEQLERFESDRNFLSYQFNCSTTPFRYANGGVLPIIRIDDTDYLCLFYRAVFPVGWNIANGAANDIDDIRNPLRIINREFSEEFIIADHNAGVLYIFDAHNDETMKGTQDQAINLWNEKLQKYDLSTYKREPIPLKWIEGDDRLIMKYGREKYAHDGFFVNITPEDNAIEVDKVALINLMGSFSFYDGEVEFKKDENGHSKGFVLDRPIGFFPIDKFMDNLDSKRFDPDFFYHKGVRYEWAEFNRVMTEDYFPTHQQYKIRTKTQHQTYELAVKNRVDLNLCPITRAVANRYKNWLDAESVSLEELQQKEKDQEIPTLKDVHYDIFISFRSKDEDIAESLYDFLPKKYNAFCSSRSIKHLGTSDYISAIISALEKAKYLIIIGSDLDSFDSGWVQFEWHTFLMLILSKKKDGEIFTLTQNIDPLDLPTGLQSRQNIKIFDHSLDLSFNNLLGYIEN